MTGPGDIKQEYKKIFKEISLAVRSFRELELLAEMLFQKEGRRLYDQFRGPDMGQLTWEETAKRLFEIWLEEHQSLPFDEKKTLFLEAMDKLTKEWAGKLKIP